MFKTVYIKLTNACNLSCKHCYNSITNNSLYMSDEILEKVILYIKQLKTRYKLQIALHGGEPLLFDINKINYLINSIGSDVDWSITTNLIYDITDKHIQLFKKMEHYENKPTILTSWDYKIRFNSNKQEQLWENNVQILHSNNINVQPIVCLSKFLINDLEPNYIYKKFEKLNIKVFNFERITYTGNATQNDVCPLNKDIDLWLYNAFIDEYYQNNIIRVKLFDNLIKSLSYVFIGCRARKCTSNVITINPDGTICNCPNMSDKPYSNINGEIDNDILTKQILDENTLNPTCLVCKYYKFCNGDCFQLKFDKSGCPGLKSIYKYLFI